MNPHPGWQVSSELGFTVEEPAVIALQVAVAGTPGRTIEDHLVATLDGRPLEVRELAVPHGGRIHQLEARPGRLEVTYRATASGPAAGPAQAGDEEHDAYERLLALRPSRYCPSDALLGFAAGELGGRPPDADLAREVVTWVSNRIAYAPGSSGPLDTAVETLLGGQGVCRDFAHLSLGLTRALGIPSRLVSAYAPGLSPMDFHAVVETHVEGAWHVFDPTHMAPRASLLRIATGRDAADTAFIDVLTGIATLERMEVSAVYDGALPMDDWGAPVRLPMPG
ncbi:MAG: transglutaminase family protein [Acidimicrobiales bacterium]